MHLLRITVLAAGFVLPLVASATGPDAAVARARRQFREFYLGSAAVPAGNISLKDTNEPPPDTRLAAQYVRTLRADGRWADLDYASRARSGWPPATHWTRMLAIAAAAGAPGAAADRAAFDAAEHRAFAFWIRHDFICPNWWYNQIGVPKLAATTALLLGDELAPAEKRYLIGTLMPRAKIGMTGQNRVWLAGNTLMFALLTDDLPLVRQASATIWGEVAATTQEGIQPDDSFHQHGPQQQFGNYGLSLGVEVCRWGTVLRGTPWAMPRAKLATYRGFLLDGEAWVVWRGFMDVSSCDRQLMPHAQAAKARTLAQVMQNVAQFDPEAAPRYAAFLRRNEPGSGPNDLVGNKVFWRSDYVIHRRPEFAAMLKMSSTRVIGAEMVNTENLLGYHLADGALYLYRRGDEYEDIFPVWDWQKLPGITCAQRPAGPPAYEHVRGEREFVGGVSDGSDGCAALDYARDGVVARKAWFFGPQAILCLGAGIRSSGTEMVATTLNQCLRRGPVIVKQAGREPRPFDGPDAVLPAVEWVEHDGWRYSFPAPASVHVSAAARTGNWQRVFTNPHTPREDVTKQVFTLWLEQPTAAGPSTYAYGVRPAGVAGHPRTPPHLIANSADLQAVVFGDGNTAAVFWAPGEIVAGNGSRVAVDRPCLLISDRDGRLFIADPTERLTGLTVTVDGRRHDVPLPSGGEAGRSVEVK